MSDDVTPAYVFDLIEAWATGRPLDFHDHPVPTDVQQAIVTRCPDCGATGQYDGRVHFGGRGVYRCPAGHMWQRAGEVPNDKGYAPVSRDPR